MQGDEKVMCWCGLINGNIILHWFDKNESVNGATYLEMLKTAVWPKVRAVATRNQYWFQQDCEPLREKAAELVVQKKFRHGGQEGRARGRHQGSGQLGRD